MSRRGSPPRPPGPEGFTLLELVMALVVIAVGALSATAVLLGTSARSYRVSSHAELTAAAEAKLEQLRQYAATRTGDTVQLAAGGSLTDDQPDHADSVRSPEGRWYVRRWRVADGPAGTRDVTLRAVSRDPAGRSVAARDFRTLILIGF